MISLSIADFDYLSLIDVA